MKLSWSCTISVDRSHRSALPYSTTNYTSYDNSSNDNYRLLAPAHTIRRDRRLPRSSQEYLLPELDIPRALSPNDIFDRSVQSNDRSGNESDHYSEGRNDIERLSRQNDDFCISKAASQHDVNLVTWDGDDDPMNPLNWPRHRKWIATLLIASFAFIAPMASTMVAPALGTIAEDFDIVSDVEQFLVMSIFLLAFAVSLQRKDHANQSTADSHIDWTIPMGSLIGGQCRPLVDGSWSIALT